MNGFNYRGNNSRDFHIIMLEPPEEVFAERDVESISIPGRSGDLIFDNGRYKNVRIKYRCAILPPEESQETMRDMAIRALNWLFSDATYEMLTNTYNPRYFRMARVVGNISVSSIVEQAGEFTIEFDCKPQKFLLDGNTMVAYDAPGVLHSSYQMPAMPLITVYGHGAATVTVAGVSVEIKNIADVLSLDCDLQNAYRQLGDSPPENQNYNVNAPIFPELHYGDNNISWTGGIERVEIIPRWWVL